MAADDVLMSITNGGVSTIARGSLRAGRSSPERNAS
jgi:hypothetical protein